MTEQEISRAADLHYAYQFGQEYARDGNEDTKKEFEAKFNNDTEAHFSFSKGIESVINKG